MGRAVKRAENQIKEFLCWSRIQKGINLKTRLRGIENVRKLISRKFLYGDQLTFFIIKRK